MLQRNPLSNYTKVDKKAIVGKESIIKELMPLKTQKGDAVVAIFTDDTYTYVPSADLDWVLDELMEDEESMKELATDGLKVTVKEHTSKNGRNYFTMF